MYTELKVYNDYFQQGNVTEVLERIIEVCKEYMRKGEELTEDVEFGMFSMNEYNVVMTDVYINANNDIPMLSFRQLYRIPLRDINYKEIFVSSEWKKFDAIYRYEDDTTNKFLIETVARMTVKDLYTKLCEFITSAFVTDRVFMKSLLLEYRDNVAKMKNE